MRFASWEIWYYTWMLATFSYPIKYQGCKGSGIRGIVKQLNIYQSWLCVDMAYIMVSWHGRKWWLVFMEAVFSISNLMMDFYLTARLSLLLRIWPHRQIFPVCVFFHVRSWFTERQVKGEASLSPLYHIRPLYTHLLAGW